MNIPLVFFVEPDWRGYCVTARSLWNYQLIAVLAREMQKDLAEFVAAKLSEPKK